MDRYISMEGSYYTPTKFTSCRCNPRRAPRRFGADNGTLDVTNLLGGYHLRQSRDDKRAGNLI